jgi:hypothetical protein
MLTRASHALGPPGLSALRARAVASLLAAGLSVAPASCAPAGSSFAVAYAPGFVKESRAVSVLGVFRDGRMSPEAWDELGPRVSRALRSQGCATAVSAGLRAERAAVFAAIDDAARAEGVTDELLDKLAPAAASDLVLVVTVAGHPPTVTGGTSHAAQSAPALTGTGRGGGGRRRGSPSGGRHAEPDTDAFELSASVFSKREHASVARVSMVYTGPSESEAVGLFAERLAASLPGVTCAAWSPELGVDAASLSRPGDR